MKRKTMNLLLVLVVMFSTMITVFADDTVIKKTANVTSNPGEFDITFTLPSKQGEINPVADVVVVLDKSTLGGTSNPLRGEAQAFIAKLWEKSQSDNVTFKVGIIWFDANVHTYSDDLVELTAENYTKIQKFLSGYIGSGSNLHGSILKAQKWLDEDTAVLSQHKFLVVMSDFAGYFFDEGNGIGLGRYAIRNENVSAPAIGNSGDPVYESNLEYVDKVSLGQYPTMSDLEGPNPDFKYTVEMIDDLISGKKLLTGIAPINSDDLTKIGANYGEYAYTQYGTNYALFTAEQIGTMPNQEYNRQVDVPTSFEKSIYLTGNLFKEMKSNNYSIFAITQDYRMTNVLGYQSRAYIEWFKENIGTSFDVTNGVSDTVAKDIFNNIGSTIFDLLGKGTITDVIADEFDYINEGFSVNIDGTELLITQISQYKYGFGEMLASSSNYEYELDYNPNTKTVTWNLNVSASRYKTLELTFKVKYTGDLCEIENTMNIETNKSAVLDYVNSIDAQLEIPYNKQVKMDSPTVSLSKDGANCPTPEDPEVPENPETPDKPDVPNTGVNTSYSTWLLLLLLATAVGTKEILNNQLKKKNK